MRACYLNYSMRKKLINSIFFWRDVIPGSGERRARYVAEIKKFIHISKSKVLCFLRIRSYY